MSDLSVVAVALFGAVSSVGPLELEATRAALARHNLAVSDVAKWLAARDTVRCI
jgi:hypothetical protein